MTLEKLREINDVALMLVDSKHRLESLDSLFQFLDDYESDCDERLGLVTADVYNHGVAFETEHFKKFLKVEITRLEREVERLENQLESM